ncbi:hypothetical protein NHX12_009910 [Muraenolepis orangiensis]|uniref:Uncharacterized protein n=1 Tax=Muraenolepis orangiensis TaxID=630683 RepID=A0A9Q0I6T3_9TELE|nr:hypothetical protein NHX12_009910 [Muraenolepis orangiensis]
MGPGGAPPGGPRCPGQTTEGLTTEDGPGCGALPGGPRCPGQTTEGLTTGRAWMWSSPRGPRRAGWADKAICGILLLTVGMADVGTHV